MSKHTVVEDFVIRCILVVGVALAMLITGETVEARFLSLDIPYAGEIGFLVGAALVFAVFAVVYRGYGAYWNDE